MGDLDWKYDKGLIVFTLLVMAALVAAAVIAAGFLFRVGWEMHGGTV